MILRNVAGIFKKMSSTFRTVINRVWLLTDGTWDDTKYWRDDATWNDN